MTRGKKRNINQKRGDKGIRILETLFPESWVIREMNPDFGIDFEVELFEKYDDKNDITKGEYLYFQVKTKENIEVEKHKIKYNKTEYKEIDVVIFDLETDLISTVEKMGTSVPVILAYVDETNANAYFVCLNDYIDKILIDEKKDYSAQEKKRIFIPIANQISSDNSFINKIEFYAKRAKLYSLFNKIYLQKTELEYCRDKDQYLENAQKYSKYLLRLDAWSVKNLISVLEKPYNSLNKIVENGYFYDEIANKTIENAKKNNENINEKTYESNIVYDALSLDDVCKIESIKRLWDTMANLAVFMDNYWVNWFLPTYLGITLNE